MSGPSHSTDGAGTSAPRVGPKAAEDENADLADPLLDIPDVADERTGLSLRAMLPNAVTAAALCSGLTAIRFAVDENWSFAVLAILLAGILDGMDGRIARMLNAQSRFGAELDSLADCVSFGIAPALVLFMWSLKSLPSFGWFAALGFAICMALRLARFNAMIDVEDQPHKSAGFLTGVPAPVGGGLALAPLILWIEIREPFLRDPIFLALWVSVIAALLISNMATLSWTAIRPQRDVRIWVIALVGLLFAGVLLETWWTLTAISAGYLALMPYALFKYGKIKRDRA
ncbi:MAG: phosphatidylcholine/phosphatidylserine synthase [Erythrobacter sp.]|uniref:CDP-alcohol phosphatidyltransferase family protein n=1 Tax=Erythrobacter sp. TaxID=1042 RepID=UPI003266DA91